MLKTIAILLTFSFYNVLFIISYFILLFLIRQKLRSHFNKNYGSNTRVVSFLHPFCNDCGGGEKVLWMIIKGLCDGLNKGEKLKINILCGVKEEAQIIKKNLKDRFELDFDNLNSNNIVDIELIRLKTAHYLKPKSFMTMILQILGQFIFAFEIIKTAYSDVIVETTGLPFTYSILRLLGMTRIVSYVHYPFISDDMIQDIKKGVEGVHSRGIFGRIKLLKYVKVIYYYLILLFYKLNGVCVYFAFANSSWTLNHIKKIWSSTPIELLYPPCSTNLYDGSSKTQRENMIVSCAQFRPEKRQKMQVDIFGEVIKHKGVPENLKLVITGAVRDEQDRKLFNEVQDYVKSKGLEGRIEVYQNLPWNLLKEKFESAKIGLHTMRDEHFGISIIEMMSAGLLTIAHQSAGPLNDIIGVAPQAVGLLANTVEEYAEYIIEAIRKTSGMNAITMTAKDWVKKFSNESFMENFNKFVKEKKLF